MTDLKEFLFGLKDFEMKSSKSINDCVGSIGRLHQPRKLFQLVDTIVDVNHRRADYYEVEIRKQRHFRIISMTSAAFRGHLEADASGKATLRGQFKFQEWYYIVIAVTLVVVLIWTATNPSYLVLSLLFLLVILIVANWFARSDKESLLNEIEYAVR